MATIGPNMRVTLDYVLRDETGDILADSADEEVGPLEYVQGYGMIVPGLERAVLGLAEGSRKEVRVSPDEAYGDRDEDLVFETDRSEMPDPDDVEPGDELGLAIDGEEVTVYVAEVDDDRVVLDANHPLAGQTLLYDVTVRAVRPATDEEIAAAAASLEEAEEEAAAEAGVADASTLDGAPEVSVYALNRNKDRS